MNSQAVLDAIARLDAWLDTMRGPNGYGGPVAHWWESNFLYTGPLYDWRYEGIIDGYRELYLRTGQVTFLRKAIRAADDVVPHLLPDGRFRNSSFQFGPVRGGTPHEAAIDVALLKLVRTLRDNQLSDGKIYLETAEANLRSYWIGQLWDGAGFRDQPYDPVFVANKHGTLLEALLQYEELTGSDCDKYIRACVQTITRAQVLEGPQSGGTVHEGIGPSRLAIPLYTARAMNGLVSYYERKGDEAIKCRISRAASFVSRLITPRGLAWGIYGSGRPCPNPHIIAGAGDALRFLFRVKESGLVEDYEDVEDSIDKLMLLLLNNQQATGAITTGKGFAAMALMRTTELVDLRDVLPVVGWIDKAFRALSICVPKHSVSVDAIGIDTQESRVHWRGKMVVFKETSEQISVTDTFSHTIYLWDKIGMSPRIYAL